MWRGGVRCASVRRGAGASLLQTLHSLLLNLGQAHAGERAKITLYTEETVDAVPVARAEPRSAITEAVIEEEPPAAATRSDGGG